MKNPFANILQNKRFLWPIIVAVPLILIVVVLLILNAGRISDSELTRKDESPKTTSAVAAEELMLVDREWALIALEKKYLEEKESEIERKLNHIKDQYQKLEKDHQTLLTVQGKLDERAESLIAEQNLLDEKELKLEQRELLVLEKEKEKKKLEEQQAAKEEEPVEDKIAKQKRLRKIARGFETMRARDAADILINMLEKDREDVLDLLRVMDIRTRTRIISAVSRERVDTAADLTKELMEIQ